MELTDIRRTKNEETPCTYENKDDRKGGICTNVGLQCTCLRQEVFSTSTRHHVPSLDIDSTYFPGGAESNGVMKGQG
jgi:hypothetical protein